MCGYAYGTQLSQFPQHTQAASSQPYHVVTLTKLTVSSKVIGFLVLSPKVSMHIHLLVMVHLHALEKYFLTGSMDCDSEGDSVFFPEVSVFSTSFLIFLWQGI